MRHLTYVKLVHNLPEGILFSPSPEQLREEAELRSNLVPYMVSITAKLRDVAAQRPINKIYLDGMDTPFEITAELIQKNPVYIPLVSLLKKGARLIPTEDPVLLLVQDMILREAINQGREPQYNSPREFLDGDIGQILKMLKPGFYYTVEMACESEEKFDIIRLRDKHVAKTIDDTLLEDEHGVLFMGKVHKVDERLKERGSNIQIGYVDVFPEIEA